ANSSLGGFLPVSTFSMRLTEKATRSASCSRVSPARSLASRISLANSPDTRPTPHSHQLAPCPHTTAMRAWSVPKSSRFDTRCLHDVEFGAVPAPRGDADHRHRRLPGEGDRHP